MRYKMKQRLFSMADRFTIQNDADEDVGHVDGKTFSLGHKLAFHDVRGNEVARIEQKLMSWGPTYEIVRDGEVAAVMKKKLFKLYPTFTIEVIGGEELTIEGDITDHEYVFVRGDRTVASVSKRWWSFADTYGVEILDDEDHILILACTVVVDLVNHHGDDD